MPAHVYHKDMNPSRAALLSNKINTVTSKSTLPTAAQNLKAVVLFYRLNREVRRCSVGTRLPTLGRQLTGHP